MPYATDIQSLEDEINKLGESLCKLLKPALDTDRLRGLEFSFLFKHYWSAIESIEWYIEEKILTLPETALDNWTQLKTHADKAKKLYALQRESDGGFTNPITHMNALMKADDKIPDGFNKRYGLKRGGAKSLWLANPSFEERFVRKRISGAVARGGNRTGHYIFIKRRYKLTDTQSKRLVDDMWENMSVVSKVFHEFIDAEWLINCRLTDRAQDQVRQIQADFGGQLE